MNESRRNMWAQVLCGPPLSRSQDTCESMAQPHAPWNFDQIDTRYPEPYGMKQKEASVAQARKEEPTNG